MAANQTYTLRLLGSLEIEGNRSQPITLRRKARALLAYLAVSSQLQPRHELATLFCAEADDPGRALRLLLSRIRRRVKQNILVAAGDAIGFNAQAGWVDCLAFEQEMKSGDPTPDAINLYRGNFLSNLALPDAPEFELWVLSQRSYYRQLYERGLIRLISQLSDQKQYEAAIPFAQKLVQSNSLLEEGHARLIWLYAQTGQRKAALAQYEQCRAWLVRELAVGPGDTLRQLATDIRNGRLGRPDPPRLESAVAPQAQPANSLFVGREAELRQIATAWESKHGGVILISAPAGGGKTSLVAKFRERFLALTCLNGRCYESTRGLPYQPWIELIQAYLADIDDETLAPLSPLTRA
ncbi:MAG: BTAD domain-containing putative transcriptional regulator [Anaerolineae bacterium]